MDCTPGKSACKDCGSYFSAAEGDLARCHIQRCGVGGQIGKAVVKKSALVMAE